MESASVAAPAAGQAAAPALKKGAVGYISNIVIGVASTAPGYSLAATLGVIAAVGGIGLQSPAIMIVSFLPMLCIAAAYYYLNRADPDCGTTFTWVGKAIGPKSGWLAGWAIIVADVLVMPSLAYVAGQYTFQLFGWTSAQNSDWAILALGVGWIVLMTWICYRGVELSARTQQVLLSIEVFTLVLFAVVALIKVYANHPDGSIEPAFSWFNPFDISSTSALTGGVLLGVFIYWGWDSGVAVNEESDDPASGPGKSAIISTLILVGIYLIVTVAAQAYGGTKVLIDNPDDVFAPIGKAVLGGVLYKLLIISVLTSASASTQTTILPTARTSLSMARQRAMPKAFGHIHKDHLSPDVSTLAMGGASILLFIVLVAKDVNLVFDAFTALGLMICFYYGLTGFACTVYYRRHVFQSAKNFFFIGVLPVLGGLSLTAVFVKSLVDLTKPDSGYAGPWLGVGAPFVIAMIMIVLGFVLLAISIPRYRDYFQQKASIVDPKVLEPGSAPAAPTSGMTA
jgi:amino acid transporter